MRILITNCTLDRLGGTQTVVINLCRLLRRRGHEVMIFSMKLGHVAEMLEAEMFPVVTDLKRLPRRPDLIHGQHHLETIAALLGLPGIPAIYYQHGAIPWEERVPIHPRILRYVNLSEGGQHRLMMEKSLPVSRCAVMRNHVVLEQFSPPRARPEKLKTAVLCCRGLASPEIVKNVRRICQENDIELKHDLDWGLGKYADPRELFSRYDLIFGTGRTALEALAFGCAVSTTDHEMLGPLISTSNLQARRELNLSRTLWEESLPPETLSAQLAAYTEKEQNAVMEAIRDEADAEKSADQLVSLYTDVINEWSALPHPTADEEMAAASDYLRALGTMIESEMIEKPRLLIKELEKKAQHFQQLAQMANQENDRLKTENKKLTALGKNSQRISDLWTSFVNRSPLHQIFTRGTCAKIDGLNKKVAALHSDI